MLLLHRERMGILLLYLTTGPVARRCRSTVLADRSDPESAISRRMSSRIIISLRISFAILHTTPRPIQIAVRPRDGHALAGASPSTRCKHRARGVSRMETTKRRGTGPRGNRFQHAPRIGG